MEAAWAVDPVRMPPPSIHRMEPVMTRLTKSRLHTRLLLAALTMAAGAAHAGSITVYTSLEEDEIKDYVAAAKKDMPDIDVKVLRLSLSLIHI